MNKKLEYFLKFLIGATFFVPLVVIPSQYIFPFIVPKIIFFRSLVLLMLGGYLVLLASDWQKYKVKFTLTNAAVGLFFISFSVSTFVGVDWYKSFWDNHERMLGLFTIFHYIIYYIVITSLVREWKDWKWLLRLFLLAGSIVMLIGVWQKFVNPDFFLNKGSARVSATLGNAIYYSGYGLFITFIGYLLAIKEKKWSFWQWYAVAGAILGFLGIFLGGTRGTLLGLLAGVFVLFASYVFALKEHRSIRKVLGSLIVLSFVLFGLVFVFRQTNFVKQIPVVGNLLNTSISSGTAHTRIMAWGIAIDAWKENPVFGWGPNNYYYAFNKYYRPEFLELGWGETWFDNAHSAVMNTLAVQGVFGLLLYVGLFAAPMISLWKKRKADNFDLHILAVGNAFFIAHFVHNAFVFENPTSYLYFFFFLAFVNQRTSVVVQSAANGREKDNKDNKLPITFSSIVVLVILLLIYSTNINPARANMATLETIKGLQIGGDVPSLYEKALSVPSPHVDDIRNDFARTVTPAVQQLLGSNQNAQAKKFFELAYNELEKNIVLHPMDIRVHIQQAQLAQLGAQINQDPLFIIKAESILEEALKYSPRRQQLQYMLSAIKLQLGKSQDAIDLLEDSIENDYKIAEGWWRLSIVYYQSGDIKKAQEIILEARDRGVVFTEQGEQVIDQILASTSVSVDTQK